jgi:hypothetical protein
MIQVPNNQPAAVFSFVRANDKDKVFAVFNFSGEDRQVSFSSAVYEGRYRDFASGESAVLGPELSLALPAWSYRVFIQ